MTDYARAMQSHLAAFKRKHHSDLEDGIHRKSARSYPHILPEASHRLNILPAIREDFWSYFQENAATLGLHTDFHHLNSSQAFAFNLFYPWARAAAAQQLLLAQLGVPAEPLRRWCFECMPDPFERTTFDFYGEYSSGARLLVEVKLTEAHFGQAAVSDSHRKKREEVYLSRLIGKVAPESLEEARFLLHYQLLRNVSHLDPARGDHLVLLVPRANTFTWSQANAFMEWLLPPVRAAVRVVSVEDLLEALATSASALDGILGLHAAQLTEKYVPAMESFVPAPTA